MENKQRYNYVLFLLDLLDKANSNGFKIITNENSIDVLFPGSGQKDAVNITNINDFDKLTCEIIKWK